MFALRVWVGFGASWRGGILLYLAIKLVHGKGSEGHFLSIVFGRTLFEYGVRKDTFQNMINKNFLNKVSPINFKMV